MANLKHPAPSGRPGFAARTLAAVIPAGLFFALKQLHQPKNVFHEISIASQSPDEPATSLAELARAESVLVRNSHIEMIALTLLALAVLICVFLRKGDSKLTKYLLIAAVAVSMSACWLQW